MIWTSPAPALIAFGSLFALFIHTPALANPVANLNQRGPDSEPCENPLQRKEWRALTDDEKKSYIDAVKCLQTRPAQDASRNVTWTRFDEFLGTHANMSTSVHLVAQFLPWHRLFIKSYENALRLECGYQGAQPYWDSSIDADPPNLISKSPIWDPITGFGGDGVPGTYTVPSDPANTSDILPDSFYHGCIHDGPFANYTLKFGPGLLVTQHCLTRGINDTFAYFLNSSLVNYTLSFPTFEPFSIMLEGEAPNFGPHGGGHLAIGGDMTNVFTSPGDPIFYLHHANIDRIWWVWQQVSPNRLYEVSGTTTQGTPTTPPSGNLTLDYMLNMCSLGSSFPVQDVMDIRNEPSCYTYV